METSTYRVRALAEQRLAELEAEVAKAKFFLALFDHFAGVESGARQAETRPGRKTKCATPEGVLRKVCISILKERGGPMRWHELRDAVEARGHVVDGRCQRSRIVTAMWRGRPEVMHTDQGYAIASMVDQRAA